MEYIIYIIIFLLIVIPLLKLIDKDLEDDNVYCSCYTDRENLNSQKECYFKQKNK